MGDCHPALCALALIIAPALAADSAAPSAGAAERRYVLEAADGVPGAVHVDLALDRLGAFTATAVWTGRTTAGLWIENEQGQTLARVFGVSPQSISIDVDGRRVAVGETLRFRFAPSVARGALHGMLTIAPVLPPPPRVAPKPAPLAGPGKVLEPVFADPAAGKPLRTLAEALEGADANGVDWTRRWSNRLAAAASAQDTGLVARGEFDKLWAEIVADPAPAPSLDKAFRGVLAAVEDVVRQEQRGGKGADALRQRREALVAALARLGSPSP